jgi:hypothetical protein
MMIMTVGLCLLMLGYWIGSYSVTPRLTAALSHAGFEDRRGELERQVEQLQGRLAIAERSAQIASQASEQVRLDLIARQETIRKLANEVAFYRGIVSERNGKPGPRLYGFEMDPVSGQLELILVEGNPEDKTTAGSLEVRLIDANAEAGDLDALHARFAPVVRTNYRFEFFQKITLQLGIHQPSGILLVTLLPEEKGREPWHFIRKWPEEKGIDVPLE